MIYSNPKSKIVHVDNCPYVKNKLNKAIAFSDMKITNRQGYRPCKKCNPLQRKWKAEKSFLLPYAKEKDISLHLENSYINVVCGEERWKIVINQHGTGISLYHQNLTAAPTDNYVPYYHKQNVDSGNIMRFLRYVHEHRLYRKSNPLPPPARKKLRKCKKNKREKQVAEDKPSVLDLLKSLHKEEYYKDFLCYIN